MAVGNIVNHSPIAAISTLRGEAAVVRSPHQPRRQYRRLLASAQSPPPGSSPSSVAVFLGSLLSSQEFAGLVRATDAETAAGSRRALPGSFRAPAARGARCCAARRPPGPKSCMSGWRSGIIRKLGAEGDELTEADCSRCGMRSRSMLYRCTDAGSGQEDSAARAARELISYDVIEPRGSMLPRAGGNVTRHG